MAMGEKNNSKLWATITITGFVLAFLGSVTSALINIIPDISPSPTDIPVEKMKTVQVYASEYHSGSSVGQGMLTFNKSGKMTGPGDTPKDLAVKAFFSFSIGEILYSSEIVDVVLRIPCAIEGNPEQFGRLILSEYSFGVYENNDFENVPSGTWGTSWSYFDMISKQCNSDNGAILVSGNSLTKLIQERLSTDWVQFAFYFENKSTNNNSNRDAIILTSIPIIQIKYREP